MIYGLIRTALKWDPQQERAAMSAMREAAAGGTGAHVAGAPHAGAVRGVGETPRSAVGRL